VNGAHRRAPSFPVLTKKQRVQLESFQTDMQPGLEPAQATPQSEEQRMSLLDVVMAAGCVLLVIS
jgi:hypothetical protein